MISIKFILPIVIVFVTIIEGLYFYITSTETFTKNIEKDYYESIKNISIRNKENIEYLIRKKSFERIREQIASMGSNVNILETMLINEKNIIDASMHLKFIGEMFTKDVMLESKVLVLSTANKILLNLKEVVKSKRSTIFNLHKNNKIVAIYPIDYGINSDDVYNDNNGALLLIMDTSKTKHKVDQILKEQLVPLIAFMIISAILLTVILHFYIIARINRLKFQCNEYEMGKNDIAFIVDGNDEIAELGSTFNVMIKSIEHKNSIIKDKEENLELLVHRRTEQLHRTIENLKNTQSKLLEFEKMASLGSLVAGISHEINTPIGLSLTGITHIQELTRKIDNNLQTQTLKQSSLESYIEDVIIMSESMRQSLVEAANLIKSFKSVAVDQHNLQIRTFNLHSYVKDILLNLKSSIINNNIVIENRIDDNLEITTYPGILSQIVTNFVTNSKVHAFEDGIGGLISIRGFKKDNFLVFIYKDNGAGMDKKVLKNVFDPFFTTKLGQGGSGLGMNIVYNLVTQKMHGTIVCNSTIGHGSEFIIEIPLEGSECLIK